MSYGAGNNRNGAVSITKAKGLDLVLEVRYPPTTTDFSKMFPHESYVRTMENLQAGVKARFDALGTDVAPMNPGELAGFIRSEIDKWAKMAKAAGIQPE